jgi:SAGA-associated factor 29
MKPNAYLFTVNDGGKRKKRRLEAGSPALSETSGIASARASPAPALSASTGSASMARRNSRNPDVALHPSVTGIQIPPHTGIPDSPASGAQTPGGTRILTKKERRDILTSQLPLKEGRFVAFRPPPKPGQPKNAKQEAGSTDWIQARVVRCIQGDKNRYEVEDVDDADGAEGTPGE